MTERTVFTDDHSGISPWYHGHTLDELVSMSVEDHLAEDELVADNPEYQAIQAAERKYQKEYPPFDTPIEADKYSKQMEAHPDFIHRLTERVEGYAELIGGLDSVFRRLPPPSQDEDQEAQICQQVADTPGIPPEASPIIRNAAARLQVLRSHVALVENDPKAQENIIHAQLNVIAGRKINIDISRIRLESLPYGLMMIIPDDLWQEICPEKAGVTITNKFIMAVPESQKGFVFEHERMHIISRILFESELGTNSVRGALNRLDRPGSETDAQRNLNLAQENLWLSAKNEAMASASQSLSDDNPNWDEASRPGYHNFTQTAEETLHNFMYSEVKKGRRDYLTWAIRLGRAAARAKQHQSALIGSVHSLDDSYFAISAIACLPMSRQEAFLPAIVAEHFGEDRLVDYWTLTRRITRDQLMRLSRGPASTVNENRYHDLVTSYQENFADYSGMDGFLNDIKSCGASGCTERVLSAAILYFAARSLSDQIIDLGAGEINGEDVLDRWVRPLRKHCDGDAVTQIAGNILNALSESSTDEIEGLLGSFDVDRVFIEMGITDWKTKYSQKRLDKEHS